MATKTKDRILQASRLLFNNEGVSNVAMVDIAATLDISPGNLYYHYRGKEQLIPVLFEAFSAELSTLVAVDTSSLTVLEDRWVYSFLLLETLFKYRCLHGLDAIRFDKALARRYRRLQQSLAKAIEAVSDQLQLEWLERGEVELSTVSKVGAADLGLLAENAMLLMIAWVNHAEPGMDAGAERHYLHQGVYRFFYQLSAAFDHREVFVAQCHQLLDSALSGKL